MNTLLILYTNKDPRIPNSTRGRLTERLLSQGLLTPGMLKELRKEWDEANASNSDSCKGDNDSSSKHRRKRKKNINNC